MSLFFERQNFFNVQLVKIALGPVTFDIPGVPFAVKKSEDAKLADVGNRGGDRNDVPTTQPRVTGRLGKLLAGVGHFFGLANGE